tara:strand:- start:39291 stop:39650 length:360 start_codon:yes stop_codon:yes gene_type:complete
MKWIFGIAASFFALLWIAGATSSPNESEQAAKRCQSPDAAYTMAKRFVEKRLRAPSTANFPSLLSDDVQVGYAGDCTHAVKAYVDAQNGFGAQVRQTFYAKVQNEQGTANWSLLDIQIR